MVIVAMKKKQIIFFMLFACMLVACAPVAQPSPIPSPTKTAIATKKLLPTSTFLPAATVTPTLPITPTTTSTMTPTLQPTLSREQYPLLSTVALGLDDFSGVERTYFTEYFWGSPVLPPEKRAKVTVKDISQDLIDKKDGSCDLDCSMRLWTSSEQLSATITLILTKSPEVAQSLSKEFCLGIAKKINLEVNEYKDCQKESNRFGLPLPTDDSWVIGMSYHEKFFGGTYGDVFISVRLYQLRSGDDGGVNVQILFDMVTPQIQKLKQAGFPAIP
jgi:hypothetical protein